MTTQYDFVADKYDILIQASKYRVYVEAYTFFNTLGDISGLRILDLATGTGYYARAVAKMGAKEVVAIDLSKDMIGMAQQAETAEPLGIQYHVADASTFKDDDPFDLAIAVYLLHYAPTREILQNMCDQIAANLSSGARFVTYQMNPRIANQSDYYETHGITLLNDFEYADDGEAVEFQVSLAGQVAPPVTSYRWEKETLEEALTSAGFKDIRWIEPTVSPKWEEVKEADDYFDDYLAIPHALIIECVKS